MTRRPKILMVEDDTPVAMMAVYWLTRSGCDVSAAYTAEKGMELASGKKFDLIVLNTDLPINGFEICREFKQRHISRKTPVVFVSAQFCEQDVQRGLELGAVDYITKPFDVSDFVRRILLHAQKQNGPTGIIQNAMT